MLDHVALNVTDYERSRVFYLQALEALGIGIVMEMPEVKGLGLGLVLFVTPAQENVFQLDDGLSAVPCAAFRPPLSGGPRSSQANPTATAPPIIGPAT